MASNPVPAVPPEREPRRYLKCASCRERKRKCSPEHRNWELRERCHNCIAHKLPCGPNVLHKSSPGNEASPSRITEPPPNPQDISRSSSSVITPSRSGTTGSSSSALSSTPGGRVRASQDEETSPCGPSRTGAGQGAKIRDTFTDLGPVLDLFGFLQSRQSAVDKARSFHASQHHDDVEEAIAYFSECICIKLKYIFDRIVELIGDSDLNRDQEELFLRRLLSVTDRFLHLVPDIDASGVCTQFPVINELQCTVLDKLIPIAAKDDPAEAYYLDRMLSRLRGSSEIFQIPVKDVQPHETHAIRAMSKGIARTFRGLVIPKRFRRALPKTENVFHAPDDVFPAPAIHIAILDKREDIARDLLRGGQPRKNAIDILERTVSHLLVETGNLELLKQVIAQEPELSEARDVFKLTVLGVAAYMGVLKIFKALVQLGCNLGAKDSCGRSILCIASGAGHLSIVEYLLNEKGQDPNDVGIGECSPLYAAAAGGHVDVVQLLLEHAADPTHRVQQRTPLDEALARDHSRDHLLIAGMLRQAMSIPVNLHHMSGAGQAEMPSLQGSPFYLSDTLSMQAMPQAGFLVPDSILSLTNLASSSHTEAAQGSPSATQQFKRQRPSSRMSTPSPGRAATTQGPVDRNVRQKT